MNDDHKGDSLLIAKAHGYPEATDAVMTGLDSAAGYWQVTDTQGSHELRIAWPAGTITERPEIRQEIVKLHEIAHQKLGIKMPERAEQTSGESTHGHGSHGANPHGGHGHPGSKKREPLPADAPFSAVVRESNWGFHTESEGADFMANIMRGIAPLEDYKELVIQHYVLYKELELASDKLSESPLTAGFDTPELRRINALEKDLQHLIGENWQAECVAVPASKQYAARIKELAAEGWLPGIVAHHYTRYLGDLSGGQMIAKRMRKQHGLESNGVAFYEFAELGDLNEFKNQYRAQLDRLGESLSTSERERFLKEVEIAYGFNTEVFNQLAAQKAERTQTAQ